MGEYTPNSFQVPNIVVDYWMRVLPGLDYKCLNLIIRKTRGWNKDADAIAISQFKQFTGVNRDKTILASLGRLADVYRVIERKRTPGKMTEYRLSALFENGPAKPGAESAITPGAESAITPGAESATLQNTLIQNTNTKDHSPSGEPSASDRIDYPEWFLTIWKSRPIRAGGDPKSAAYREALKRINEGHTIESLQNGLTRYKRFSTATGKVGTEHSMQLKRFFGGDCEFLEAWTIPSSTTPVNKPAARLPRSDDDLVSWAAREGFSKPRPGQGYPEYRSLLSSEVEQRRDRAH